MFHLSHTMTAMLRDPLIRQVMRADGVSLAELAQVLSQASSKRRIGKAPRSISLPDRRGYDHAG